MREIKCRAKSQITGEWLLGTYIDGYIINGVIEANSEYISIENWEAVYPESRGQYTGLTDKNGVEIYEGDIIRIETYNKRYYVNKIFFEQGTFHFGYLPDGMCDYREMEVIGNIYENPELLEGAK